MTLKMIHTPADHEAALRRIEALFDAPLGTPECEELEILSVLVAHYEEEAFPIDLPDAIDALRFRMDQQGLMPKDLVPYIGSASKVSEVLNRRRGLSLAMIRNLSEGLGIPAEVLIRQQRNAPTRRRATTRRR